MNMSDKESVALAAAGVIAAGAVAQAADKRAKSDPLAKAGSDKRMDGFKASPDPWGEVAKMEYGGDRAFASTIQTLVLDADPSQYPGFEKKLLAIIGQADCTLAAKDFVCRMLYYIGSEKCVAALTPMLEADAQSDMARYALQRIEGSAIDAAFRAALPKLTGRAKAGLIGSIAARKDTAAIPLLKAIAEDAAAPTDVKAAATRAVAWIQSH